MAWFGERRKRRKYERAAERYPCRIAGQLHFCDSGVEYDGMITNISMGGASFRPALTYLLSRKGGEVIVRVGAVEISGELMGTSPQGYGLRFHAPLAADRLDLLLALTEPLELA